MKILYFVTEDWYFCMHWLALARAVRAEGYQVSVLTRVSEHAERIRDAGLHLIPIELSRRGMNPISELALLRRLVREIAAVRPDLVHNIAQKPVLYGTLAARIAGVRPVTATLAGMGFLFTSDGAKARLLRPLVVGAYRALLNGRGTRVIVQNPEDSALLAARAGLPATLIRGAGVDLERFQPSPEPTDDARPVVMLASRLLWDKGIGELVEAGRLLAARGVAARIVLVGKPDPGNPSAVEQSQLERWVAEGAIEWWGFRADMPRTLAESHIVCLPSYYREGLPTILLEAAAAGRALVTTDHPGCREAVRPGVNGLLVPPRDARALADALERLIRDAALRAAMGRASRALAEQDFGIERVVAATVEVYRDLLGVGARGSTRT